jgi:uncharacterized cupin superfamily protein
MLMLDGEAVLRTPDGERTVGPGEVVDFPRGAASAHQVINRSVAAVGS